MIITLDLQYTPDREFFEATASDESFRVQAYSRQPLQAMAYALEEMAKVYKEAAKPDAPAYVGTQGAL